MEKPTRGERRRPQNNPWEILVGAALFFFPVVFMLFHARPDDRRSAGLPLVPSAVSAVSEHGAHIFGLVAIGLSVVFIWFYFYLRRFIAHDNTIEKPRWR